jgi:hypothetical protein
VSDLRQLSFTETELPASVAEGSEKGQMKRSKKIPWDDASYLMRSDVEREKKPRLVEGGGKLPYQPFSFDWAEIRRVWAEIGIIQRNEGKVRAHVFMLAEWQRRLKKTK